MTGFLLNYSNFSYITFIYPKKLFWFMSFKTFKRDLNIFKSFPNLIQLLELQVLINLIKNTTDIIE